MRQFAEWLSTTAPSVFIQENNTWFIPLVQSIHCWHCGSVWIDFLIAMRILGVTGMDQSLRTNHQPLRPVDDEDRYGCRSRNRGPDGALASPCVNWSRFRSGSRCS